jgi:hypothetical protein
MTGVIVWAWSSLAVSNKALSRLLRARIMQSGTIAAIAIPERFSGK